MNLVTVRPVEGHVVQIPGTASILAATGRTVDLDRAYWRERLAEGSIALVPTSSAPLSTIADPSPAEKD